MESDVEKLRAEVKRLEAELKKLQIQYDLTLRAYYFEKGENLRMRYSRLLRNWCEPQRGQLISDLRPLILIREPVLNRFRKSHIG